MTMPVSSEADGSEPGYDVTWQAGAETRHYGSAVSYRRCPHNKGTLLYQAWMNGWHAENNGNGPGFGSCSCQKCNNED